MTAKVLPLGVTAVMLPELDFDEQLALCRLLDVTHYSLRPRIIPADQRGQAWGNWGNHKFDLTPERLVREAKLIRKKIDDAGMVPFGTVPGASVNDNDEILKQHFEGVQAVGAGRVRVSPPSVPGGPFDYNALVDQAVAGFQRAVALAKPYKQKIVIETHSYSLAASPALALNICRHFAPEEVSAIFDIANFNIEGNYQPTLAVAVLGPYIDHVHIGGVRRGSGTYDGFGFVQSTHQSCPLTESALYIPAWVKALFDAKRHVPLIIEVYTENVPGSTRLTEAATSLHRIVDSLS